MRARFEGATFALAFLFARTASAGVDAVAMPGGGLLALAVHVDLGRGRVSYQSCPETTCAVNPSSPGVDLGVDRSALPLPTDVASVMTEVVPISSGKSLVHVRVPLGGGSDPFSPAWEGLFAARAEPIFAGVTGWTRGEAGERTGLAVEILGDGEAKTVVVGDIQEDLRICGETATLLRPLGLDPKTLELRGATLQRLSKQRRADATPILASGGREPAPPPLAPLLVARGASSAIGPPRALVDVDAQSTWSEGRPGQGQGEFVVLGAPHEVPITRFAVAVAPASPKPQGAAPRTFFLVTDSNTYEVTLPEDAWLHPNTAYDVSLPEPVRTSCVALVLGTAFARGNAHPEVTVAELYAYSEWDGPTATLATVAMALAGGGPRAEAAAGVLKRAGDRGVTEAAAAYKTLDPAGRALAVEVAASAPSCAASAVILTRALVDLDEVVREKARAKLEQPHCAHEAVPALLNALASPETRARAAALVASIAPSLALAPIANVLGQGSPDERAQLRSAFAHAATFAPAPELASLVSQERARDARIELLRAAEARLGDIKDVADECLEQLLSGTPSARTRYLLEAPIASLAKAGDARDEEWLVALLKRDEDAAIRAHAAQLAGASRTTEGALADAVADGEPRVRDAALRTIASSRVVAAQGAAGRALEKDPWAFVRVSAAAALAALPPSEASELVLDRSLEDPSPAVRAVAILALATHEARASAPHVRARLIDAREDPEVRVAAARALGALCDTHSIDKLADYAVLGASSPDPSDVAVGLAATDALARIHPADLEKRLRRIRGKANRPDARRAAEAAIFGRGGCR